ncbi:hypothetical protein [Ottowia thiooxydans]|uniref:Type II secretion system protein GspC N-terminal domain-containing protein n=1 Tax=Ottowia thiooxydans TaxID=219182 RepID=A0ABV2QF28_9BURK
MNRRITPMLLALNVLLVVVLALLWSGIGGTNHWSPPAAQRPNLDDSRAALLRTHPEAGAAFAEIVDRPLFSATRRPPPPPAPEAPASAPEVPPVELDKIKMFGTINGPALRGVLAEVEGKSRFVRSGDKIGEWTLRTIRSSEAVFEKGDEERVIPLPLASGAAPAAAGNNARGGAARTNAAAPRPAPARAAPAGPAPARATPPAVSTPLGTMPQVSPRPAAPPSAAPTNPSTGDSPPAIKGSFGP